MQSCEQSSPAEAQESIQYSVLEGLLPPPTSLRSTRPWAHSSICTRMSRLLPAHPGRATVYLLRPLLAHYPQWVPYEIIHASFYQGYDRLCEQRITQAQARLDPLREEKLWDAELRPIRNVMTLLRLKLREVGMETINVLETGSMLIKNPKWRSPLEQ
jgi:hypothetical protein